MYGADKDDSALPSVEKRVRSASWTAYGSSAGVPGGANTSRGTARNADWIAGVTMRAIERAAREAWLTYPRGDEGRRRAHWRVSILHDGPLGSTCL